MTKEDRMNAIKNELLAKLTVDEARVLGLQDLGFGLYQGELKARYAGAKRTSRDGVTFEYDFEGWRIEFTELVNTVYVRQWAARIWDKSRNCYDTCPMGIKGCDFFR